MSLCILFYILSAILGAFLSWLMLSNREKETISKIKAESELNKSIVAKLVSEFDDYKAENQLVIDEKDAEIKSLSKNLLASPSDTNSKDLNQWKKKVASLEATVVELKKTPITENSEVVDNLKKNLIHSAKLIEEKNASLVRLKKSLKKQKGKGNKELLNKQIKKLKKKLKKQQKKIDNFKPHQQTIEIKESLDLKKLIKLLSDGELTSKSKKVVSK